MLIWHRMDKAFLTLIEPLIYTRPMFGVFAIGDGSGWFCASCGRKSDTNIIVHKTDCREQAHWKAIKALKLAMEDAGI